MTPANAAACRWVEAGADLSEIADFLTRTISQDPRYISHGEIQTGLSEDGQTWSPRLQERMREDLHDLDAERSVAEARDAAGALVAAAIVCWTRTDRVTFATLEDLAVLPAARSSGIGAAMFDLIERRAREQGCAWIFLESGLDNERAHAFFERAGLRPVSKVFAKRL